MAKRKREVNGAMAKDAAEKEARLARALRDNLRRRKGRAREVDHPCGGDANPPPPDPDATS